MINVSKIRILKNRVEKSGDPLRAKVEVYKMRQAAGIGVSSGLFRVPEVYDYNPHSGLITMERIPAAKSIRSIKFRWQDQLMLARCAGAALNAIHENLMLPEEMKIPLPVEFTSLSSQVYIHGDYNGENVSFTNGENPKLVIFDWQMSAIHGGQATFGTKYFDISWYLNNIFTKMPHRYLFQADAHKLAECFIRGYFNDFKLESASGFLDYHEKFMRVKMELRRKNLSRGRRALYSPGHWIWARFIQSAKDRFS